MAAWHSLPLGALLAGQPIVDRSVFKRTDFALHRWGAQTTGSGDFVVFSAHALHAEDGRPTGDVAIAGLGHGLVEQHWLLTTWPRCLFPDASGAYAAGPRALVLADTEGRIANPRIALHKAVVIVCTAPAATGRARRPAPSPHVRLVLGGAQMDVPYASYPPTERAHLSVCTRVFGDSVHTQFVREWFGTHRAHGITHFTMHDHGTSAAATGAAASDARAYGAARPDLGAVISEQPLGSVEAVALHGPYRTWAFHQKLASYDCLYRRHAASAWLLYVDIDEIVWVHRRPLGALLARVPAETGALGLQFADVLTSVCVPAAEAGSTALLARMLYICVPNPFKTPKNCVGGKYVLRPARHVRTQLNNHAPEDRARPACVMPELTVARVNHYHQLEHSGVLAEKAAERPWRPPVYCEEAAQHRLTSARVYKQRYVRVGWNDSTIALPAGVPSPFERQRAEWLARRQQHGTPPTR